MIKRCLIYIAIIQHTEILFGNGLVVCVFIWLQQRELKRVLLFALEILQQLEQQAAPPFSREVTALLMRMLAITEHVLSWAFIPKNDILLCIHLNQSTQPLLVAKKKNTLYTNHKILHCIVDYIAIISVI